MKRIAGATLALAVLLPVGISGIAAGQGQVRAQNATQGAGGFTGIHQAGKVGHAT